MNRWQRTLLGLIATLLLGLVFCLYLRPDMVFDLASRWWSCL